MIFVRLGKVATYARGEEPKAPAKNLKIIRAAMLGDAAATAFQSVNMTYENWIEE